MLKPAKMTAINADLDNIHQQIYSLERRKREAQSLARSVMEAPIVTKYLFSAAPIGYIDVIELDKQTLSVLTVDSILVDDILWYFDSRFGDVRQANASYIPCNIYDTPGECIKASLEYYIAQADSCTARMGDGPYSLMVNTQLVTIFNSYIEYLSMEQLRLVKAIGT
jgi:hypothetical protein